MVQRRKRVQKKVVEPEPVEEEVEEVEEEEEAEEEQTEENTEEAEEEGDEEEDGDEEEEEGDEEEEEEGDEEETAETAEDDTAEEAAVKEEDTEDKKDKKRKKRKPSIPLVPTHTDTELGKSLIQDLRHQFRLANQDGTHYRHVREKDAKTEDKPKNTRPRDIPAYDPNCDQCQEKDLAQTNANIIIACETDRQLLFKRCLGPVVISQSSVLRTAILNRRQKIRDGKTFIPMDGEKDANIYVSPGSIILKVDSVLHRGIWKVIEWMHTGSVRIDKDNFEEIATAAVYLNLHRLIKKLPKLARTCGVKWVFLETSVKEDTEENSEEETMDTEGDEEDEVDDSDFPVIGGNDLEAKVKGLEITVLGFIPGRPDKGGRKRGGSRNTNAPADTKRPRNDGRPRRDDNTSPRRRYDNRQPGMTRGQLPWRTQAQQPGYMQQGQFMQQPNPVYYGQQFGMQQPQFGMQQQFMPQGYQQGMPGQYGFR